MRKEEREEPNGEAGVMRKMKKGVRERESERERERERER